MEKFDLLTLGEVLLRLSPKENKRIVRSTEFESHVGGAELNVASGVSLLGLHTGIISKLPANAIGELARSKVRYISRTVYVSAVSAMTIWYGITRRMQDLVLIFMRVLPSLENRRWSMTESTVPSPGSRSTSSRRICISLPGVSMYPASP